MIKKKIYIYVCNQNEHSVALKKLCAFNRQLTFLCFWQRTQTIPVCCFCVQNESLQGVFTAEQTGQKLPFIKQVCVCCLCSQKGCRGGRKRKKIGPVSYFSGVWASLQAFIPSLARPISHIEASGRRGDGRIPLGLTQSPLMEPEVERPCEI